MFFTPIKPLPGFPIINTVSTLVFRTSEIGAEETRGWTGDERSTLVSKTNEVWADLVRRQRDNRMLCAIGRTSPALPLNDLDIKLEPIPVEVAQLTHAKYLPPEEAWIPGYGSRLLAGISSGPHSDSSKSYYWAIESIANYAVNLSSSLDQIYYEVAFVARECSVANAIGIAWMFLNREQRKKCAALASAINLVAEQIELVNGGYIIMIHREDSNGQPLKPTGSVADLMGMSSSLCQGSQISLESDRRIQSQSD